MTIDLFTFLLPSPAMPQSTDERRRIEVLKSIERSENQIVEGKRKFEERKSKLMDDMKNKLEPKVWQDLRDSGVRRKYF